MPRADVTSKAILSRKARKVLLEIAVFAELEASSAIEALLETEVSSEIEALLETEVSLELVALLETCLLYTSPSPRD